MNIAATRTSRWTPIGIAAVVLGFATWWPLGLAVLAYIFWGGSVDQLLNDGYERVKELWTNGRTSTGNSGNAAFDAYRAETLKRLEEEQKEFASFVQKLREARDSEEFRRFMSERKRELVQ
jgi:hypothetical protein